MTPGEGERKPQQLQQVFVFVSQHSEIEKVTEKLAKSKESHGEELEELRKCKDEEISQLKTQLQKKEVEASASEQELRINKELLVQVQTEKKDAQVCMKQEEGRKLQSWTRVLEKGLHF